MTQTGGGTEITWQAACFAAGTRIAVPNGWRAVEDLAAGDLIMLAHGGTAPVIWLGHRAVDCTRHPHPETVWPIRVMAGAFGEGLPHRDLWLSPDHAVFVDDVLIPIKRLLNGSSIRREPRDRVVYYHVELPEHDVILAEGLPTESFLDTGGRADFDNGRTPARLHPAFDRRLWDAKGCAPLVVTGPILTAVRARLMGTEGPLARGTGDVLAA